jgi:phosphatidylserine decarboxylase
MSPTAQSSAGSPRPAETQYPPIAREGWIIIAAFFLGSFLLSSLAAIFLNPAVGGLVSLIGLPLSLWAIWFFRDPVRNIPQTEDLVICPADGVCCFVGPTAPPPELGLDPACTRVSVFMNVFNVHVNRTPIAGTIERIEYRPGKFFNASLDKASEFNERCGLSIRRDDGLAIGCVQIAGLIARRIVCRAKTGERYRAGERFGLIRFGSRVDVYLPPGIEPRTRVGDRMVAGETIIAQVSIDSAPNGQRDAESQPAVVAASGTSSAAGGN